MAPVTNHTYTLAALVHLLAEANAVTHSFTLVPIPLTGGRIPADADLDGLLARMNDTDREYCASYFHAINMEVDSFTLAEVVLGGLASAGIILTLFDMKGDVLRVFA
jgi:hypothetical protein